MNDEELKTMRKSFQTLFDRRKPLLNNPKIKKLQEKVINIRKSSIENNRKLLKIATENFKNNDIDYCFAKDDVEANNIIFKIINEVNDKNIDSTINMTEFDSLEGDSTIKVAKSKSNTLGEIAISEFLNSRSIEMIETDLGDRILQLKKTDNKPSHPTGPASHLNVNQ